MNKQYQSKNFKEYEIDFKYNLIEVQNYTFGELIEKNSLFGNIMIIEKCKTKEDIENQMNKIIETIEDKKEREIMAEIIKNIIEPNIGKNKAQEMLEKLERKEENRMSPFTKCLLDLEIKYKKEGLEKGKKIGIKQGMKQGMQQISLIAKKMLERKMEIEEIHEITGLSEEEIKKLAEIK